MHCTHNTKKFWHNQWGGQVITSDYTSQAHGVAVLVKRGLDIQIHNITKDKDGRQLIINVTYNNQKIALVNLYAPNEDDPVFFQEVFDKIQNIEADHFIVGGDFNKILDNEWDRKSKVHTATTLSSEFINQQIEQNHWVDIWRYGHMEDRQFTWYRRNPYVFSRLDLFLIQQSSIGSVYAREIWSNAISDHAFVFLEMQFERIVRGPGSWKINNSLLYNVEFIKGMNYRIDQTVQEVNAVVDMDSSLKWEVLKNNMVEYAQWKSKKVANE